MVLWQMTRLTDRMMNPSEAVAESWLQKVRAQNDDLFGGNFFPFEIYNYNT